MTVPVLREWRLPGRLYAPPAALGDRLLAPVEIGQVLLALAEGGRLAECAVPAADWSAEECPRGARRRRWATPRPWRPTTAAGWSA